MGYHGCLKYVLYTLKALNQQLQVNLVTLHDPFEPLSHVAVALAACSGNDLSPYVTSHYLWHETSYEQDTAPLLLGVT